MFIGHLCFLFVENPKDMTVIYWVETDCRKSRFWTEVRSLFLDVFIASSRLLDMWECSTEGRGLVYRQHFWSHESVDWGESIDNEKSIYWGQYLEEDWVPYLGVRVVTGKMRRSQQRTQKKSLQVGGKPGKCNILESKWGNVSERKVCLGRRRRSHNHWI